MHVVETHCNSCKPDPHFSFTYYFCWEKKKKRTEVQVLFKSSYTNLSALSGSSQWTRLFRKLGGRKQQLWSKQHPHSDSKALRCSLDHRFYEHFTLPRLGPNEQFSLFLSSDVDSKQLLLFAAAATTTTTKSIQIVGWSKTTPMAKATLKQ